ncbi:protein of unknown function [Acetoanaerobium sticklandii]|uniref:Uncharacterized protein n=1 Tax=Acetoanaerobium sticklandii (strain ATCC 12662 / DSM 519 / JCM 1433 / CCUG 9281 / NCIMB 10654 / HF) TaxID=499177 RepID=E3PY84_ACESD|nr:hypothetical protein [Acetoanaerobium sticklandii]CBH21399.1 protein of unknown function [Acetoanaerobium sticklandii]
MRAYLKSIHHIKIKYFIKLSEKAQYLSFEEDSKASKALVDSIIQILEIYSKLRKVIKTRNVLHIDKITEEEIIVFEFDAANNIETLCLIHEDSLGYKYINVPEAFLNKRETCFETENLGSSFIPELEVTNIFYDADGFIIG